VTPAASSMPAGGTGPERRDADSAPAVRRHTIPFPLWLLLVASSACAAAAPPSPPSDRDWPVTGGDPANSRYSDLTQIDRSNVHRLQVAWLYRSGDEPRQIQATPIVVDGVLYSTSPAIRAFALRADTAEELWRFDPVEAGGTASGVNRGVVYWSDGTDRRILFTAGRRIWALDASTGRPVPDFGRGGWADLADGLGRDPGDQQLVATSPGVIYGDLLIQGSRVSEGEGALPGHIRAFDVRTGAVRWVFHTIPQPGQYGYETWPPGEYRRVGGANSWAGMAVDAARGIVYAPTGSATPDFYGGFRTGQNLFANTLLALDARTGDRVWHFQTVRHDLWDYDLPAPPNLLSVRRGGRRIDAVAQVTKTGFVFLFDRESGEPLFPIEERPVPPSTLHGEQAWPTQPMPLRPAPFARQSFTEADITDLSPASRAHVLERFRRLHGPGVLFTPPSPEGTIIFPGFDGGGQWGGAATDPRGVLYVNGSDVPWIARMEPVAAAGGTDVARTGAQVYVAECAACHGADFRGDGDRTPSLAGIEERHTAAGIRQVVDRGRGFMPAFGWLPEAERQAVTAYLLGRGPTPGRAAATPDGPVTSAAAAARAPYRFMGHERWRDPDGLPAVKPPWGTLNAIDLNTGEYLWRVPLGEHPALAGSPLQPTGTEQYGGPIVTAGGLVFVAATMDEKIRAFDRDTGELLWEARLPAAGYATPSTYMVGGRQYVVIAAGGGKLGTPAGDAYVAFALPD
jgi:quinoprotein glucose dehydrogenase